MFDTAYGLNFKDVARGWLTIIFPLDFGNYLSIIIPSISTIY